MSRLIARTDVTYALGFTPYDAANPVGYQTAAQVVAQAAAAVAPPLFGPAFLAWFAGLPTTLPTAIGVAWNDGGVLAVTR